MAASSRSRPSEAPTPGSTLLRVEAGQVVVAAAGTDAADVRQVAQERLVDRAGVIIQAAGDRQVEPQPLRPGRRRCVPRRAVRAAVECLRPPWRCRRSRVPVDRGSRRWSLPSAARVRTRSACSLLTPAFSAISAATASRADLGQLVQRNAARTWPCPARPSSSSRPLSTRRLLMWMRKRSKPSARHQVVDDQRHLDVGGVGGRADGVEVALPEFAVAAVLRVFAAPDRPHVIALERRAQLADVLGGEAGERHGQVEAQGHVAAAVIGEAIELLVRSPRRPCRAGSRRTPGPACRSGRSRRSGRLAGPAPAGVRAGSSARADNRGSP